MREFATLLDLSLSEASDMLPDMGIQGNIRAADVMDSLRSLDS